MNFFWRQLDLAGGLWVLEGPSIVTTFIRLVVPGAPPGYTPPGCHWEWRAVADGGGTYRTCGAYLTRAEAMREAQAGVLPPVMLLALLEREDGLLPLKRRV